ncbi:pre-peptidase C-terminal domain-containing protein [Halogeometricum rufum]|uniref:Pre-peptidase C-terminal domain-containing protein n=1 Tax=Halogeometricum rufum TaxID=553469 RepID=A0A1I6IS43_9EURY|nr:PPC domain-containing protein [Halogeometricum rufum]SFR69557.1 pre-peptidase C-terminal domain-containing protein [Halogeometricum rufum]
MSNENTADDGVERRSVIQTGALLSAGIFAGSQGVAANEDDSTATPTADGASEGETVGCGDTITGELTEDDESGFRGDGHYQDAYQLSVEDDAFVSLTLSTSQPEDPEEGTNDPYLYLLDSNGFVLAEDDDSGGELNSAISRVRLSASETYTVLATTYAPEDTFSYELGVDCILALSAEKWLGCGDTLTKPLESSDETGFRGPNFYHDVIGFEGSAGQNVRISMSSAEGDTYVYLVAPDGEIVAQDDDSGEGTNSLVTATLDADGDHYIVATSWAPETTFEYDISLDCPPERDPEVIECGQEVAGELARGDRTGFRGDGFYSDFYAFEGTAGDFVSVLMGPPRFESGDAYLYLLDPDGRIIAEDDDGGIGTDALINRRLGADGEYTIVATSFGSGERFPYELILGCQSTGAPPCNETIACNTTVTGTLEPGDQSGFRGPNYFQDVHCFDGESGDVVTVSHSSEAFADPYLYLVDPDGTVVAEDDDSGGNLDSLIREYELTQSGTYQIVATSYARGASFDYNLTLQCR